MSCQFYFVVCFCFFVFVCLFLFFVCFDDEDGQVLLYAWVGRKNPPSGTAESV